MKQSALSVRTIALVALSLALCLMPAGAATLTWDSDIPTAGIQDGGGTWDTSLANWDNAGVNAAWPNTTGDTAIFGAANGAAGTITVAAGGVSANTLTFNAPGSGNYTLSGGAITLAGQTPWTPGTQGIVLNADATINSNIVRSGGSGLVLLGTKKLTYGGTISYNGGMGLAGTSTLSIVGGGSVSLTGTIGNQIVFAQAGSTLSVDGGAFSSTGNNGPSAGNFSNLVVNSGTFSASSAESTSGGTLYYGIRLNGASSSLSLNGGTTSVQGIANNNVSTISFNGGTLQALAQPANALSTGTFLPSNGNLTAKVQAGGAIIDTNGNNITISQVLSHDAALGATLDGGLTKNGNGALTLTAANTFTGPTVVNTGTLYLGTGGATGTLRGTVTVNSGATLDYTAANAFGYNAGASVPRLDILGGTVGGADVGNHFWNSFQLNMTGGTLKLGGTNNEFHNPTITVNASSSTAQIVPVSASAVLRLRDNTSARIVVGDGSQDVDLQISVPITQNGTSNVTKVGAGKMALTAPTNSFNQLDVAAGPAVLGTTGSTATLGSIQVGDAFATGGGSATLDIPNGTVTTGWIQLGNTGTAITATVNQTGGSVTTTGHPAESAGVRLGHYPSATTFYNLTNGTLNITNGYYLTCAVDGTGTFYQTGGEASAARVVVNARSGNLGNGTLTVQGGRLNVGSGGITNEGSGGAAVNVGGSGGTIRATASFSSSLGMTLSGTGSNAATFDTYGNTIALSGALVGSGGLNKLGDGTLTLSGLNTYAGGTLVDKGILEVSGSVSGNCRIRGSVTVNPGAELRLTGGDGTGFGYASAALPSQRVDTINVNGGLVDAGTTHLYYATVNMTAGEFRTSNGQFGNVAFNTLASPASATLAGVVKIRGDSWNNLTAHLPFTVADGAADVDLLVTANLAQDHGTGSITKFGAGTMELRGANTYDGPTTVAAGTLLVTGTNSGTGQVTVDPSATLGGTGILAAPVRARTGGHVAPGMSVGDLTVGNLELQSGSFFDVELGGLDWDTIHVNGSVSLGDAVLNLSTIGSLSTFGGSTYVIVDNDGADSIGGMFRDRPEGASFEVAGNQFVITYQGGTGNDVMLTSVPEPATLSLLAFAAAGVGGYLRRRRTR